MKVNQNTAKVEPDATAKPTKQPAVKTPEPIENQIKSTNIPTQTPEESDSDFKESTDSKESANSKNQINENGNTDQIPGVNMDLN